MFGRRILILAPHPDDEVVGAGAAIARARAAGANVAVLFLTTGVPARELLWPWSRGGLPAWVARRRAEAGTAADCLGFEIAGFLDFPTRTLRLNLCAARAAAVAALKRHRADRLWLPAWEGGHQDHDAANVLAATLIDRELPGSAVWEFSEYNFRGGQVRTQEFPFPSADEVALALSVEEQGSKRRALALYASERGNLGYVSAGREVFRPLASYDYARPAHDGLLFYQRFQWVPFRHPRVDFTHPKQVCRDLIRWHQQGQGQGQRRGSASP
ncbi:PIG-L family deacetylase [uncultured Gammaproteobacteria bacterium]